jgi:outer membrane protein OmpA-like peptidoglycan-associated protein
MRAVFPIALLAAALLAPALPAAAADPCFNPPDAMILSCLRPDLTRGIRPGRAVASAPSRATSSRPAPSPPGGSAAPAPGPGAAVQAEPAGRVDLTLAFATGSAIPTMRARQRLDAIGRQLGRPELAGLRFRIEGHTDTVGDRDRNRLLSQRRAAAVVAYLVATFAIEAARFDAVGKGQDDLPVATADDVPEPRNRVVRILALPG